MRFNAKNKRSALESAINTIVIAVIAITVLGLTMYFSRNVFTGLHDDFFTINEQLKSQIQSYMSQTKDKLYFPSTDISVGKGESKVIGIGIKNQKDAVLRYKIMLRPGKDQNGNEFSINNWFQYADKERTIEPSETHIGSIKLNIPKSVSAGSYSITFEVLDLDKDSGNVYASKDFFVVVGN